MYTLPNELLKQLSWRANSQMERKTKQDKVSQELSMNAYKLARAPVYNLQGIVVSNLTHSALDELCCVALGVFVSV